MTSAQPSAELWLPPSAQHDPVGRDGCISLAGVFQGGGAKGAAFSGALEALEKEGFWFARVAGASAGAITAALVAAGLRSPELKREVPIGLRTLAGAVPHGLLRYVRAAGRHRRLGAVFPTEDLTAWLRSCFERATGNPSPTFKDLFDRTNIELNVVAANVSRRELAVFNYKNTPHVDVALAVVASSAIPGAFPPAKLVLHQEPRKWDPTDASDSWSPEDWEEVQEGRRRLGPLYHAWKWIGKLGDVQGTTSEQEAESRFYRETIVDGGVWANYPTFVFKDDSFREWSKLPPIDEPVLGLPLYDIRATPYVDDRADGRLVESDAAIWAPRLESEGSEPKSPDERWSDFRRLQRTGLLLLLGLAIIGGGAWRSDEGWPRVLLGMILLVGWSLRGYRRDVTAQGRPPRLDHPGWSVKAGWAAFPAQAVSFLHHGILGPVMVIFPLVATGGVVVYAVVWATRTIDDPWLRTLSALALAFVGTALLTGAVVSATVAASVHFGAPLIMASGAGLPATMLAASTRVPRWIGESDSDHVLASVYEPDVVDTLTFNLSSDEVEYIHAFALKFALRQLRADLRKLASRLGGDPKTPTLEEMRRYGEDMAAIAQEHGPIGWTYLDSTDVESARVSTRRLSSKHRLLLISLKAIDAPPAVEAEHDFYIEMVSEFDELIAARAAQLDESTNPGVVRAIGSDEAVTAAGRAVREAEKRLQRAARNAGLDDILVLARYGD